MEPVIWLACLSASDVILISRSLGGLGVVSYALCRKVGNARGSCRLSRCVSGVDDGPLFQAFHLSGGAGTYAARGGGVEAVDQMAAFFLLRASTCLGQSVLQAGCAPHS